MDQQVGALFTIRGMIAGFDAFDHPRTWAQTVPKLLRSYGLDALTRRSRRRLRNARSAAVRGSRIMRDVHGLSGRRRRSRSALRRRRHRRRPAGDDEGVVHAVAFLRPM